MPYHIYHIYIYLYKCGAKNRIESDADKAARTEMAVGGGGKTAESGGESVCVFLCVYLGPGIDRFADNTK